MFGAAALWPAFRCVQTLAVNLSPLSRNPSTHIFKHLHRHSLTTFPVLILLLLPLGLLSSPSKLQAPRLPLWSINPHCLLGVVVLEVQIHRGPSPIPPAGCVQFVLGLATLQLSNELISPVFHFISYCLVKMSFLTYSFLSMSSFPGQSQCILRNDKNVSVDSNGSA